jgi:hypothetical protein
MTWQLTRQVIGLYDRNTCQHDRLTGGVRRADAAHTWANHRLTRGMFSLDGKGATWPSQGLPRGTPLLVRWLYVIKIGLVAPGVEPATSRQAKDRRSRANRKSVG